MSNEREELERRAALRRKAIADHTPNVSTRPADASPSTSTRTSAPSTHTSARLDVRTANTPSAPTSMATNTNTPTRSKATTSSPKRTRAIDLAPPASVDEIETLPSRLAWARVALEPRRALARDLLAALGGDAQRALAIARRVARAVDGVIAALIVRATKKTKRSNGRENDHE